MIKIKPFKWTYDKRKKFPELKDDGTAKIKAGQIYVTFHITHNFFFYVLFLKIHIAVMNESGVLNVTQLDVVIGDLAIKTSDTKAKFIYNIVLKIMKSNITSMLQEAIKGMILNAVEENKDAFSIKF